MSILVLMNCLIFENLKREISNLTLIFNYNYISHKDKLTKIACAHTLVLLAGLLFYNFLSDMLNNGWRNIKYLCS